MNEEHARQVAEIEQTMGDLLSREKPKEFVIGVDFAINASIPVNVVTALPNPSGYVDGDIVYLIGKKSICKFINVGGCWKE